MHVVAMVEGAIHRRRGFNPGSWVTLSQLCAAANLFELLANGWLHRGRLSRLLFMMTVDLIDLSPVHTSNIQKEGRSSPFGFTGPRAQHPMCGQRSVSGPCG